MTERAQWPPPPPQNNLPPVSRPLKYSDLPVQNRHVLLRRTPTIFILHQTTLPSFLSQTSLSVLNTPPPPVFPPRPRRTGRMAMALYQYAANLPRPVVFCNPRLSSSINHHHLPRPCPRLLSCQIPARVVVEGAFFVRCLPLANAPRPSPRACLP